MLCGVRQHLGKELGLADDAFIEATDWIVWYLAGDELENLVDIVRSQLELSLSRLLPAVS